MDKKYFAFRLLPSRPDFIQTMTDAERAVMQQHRAYWKPFLDNGTLIVYGPVLDPNGMYGLGIVAAESEEAAKRLVAQDPATSISRSDCYPMMAELGSR